MKYEEAEGYRSAIMQDFRDNGNKWRTGGHLGFYNCEFCHGLSLSETLHFVLYSWSSHLHLSKYDKIKIQNGH